MLVPERHRLLLAEVRRRGSAQIEELADVLGVSASTVRRDLALLEADGALNRAHGGAYVGRREPGPRPSVAGSVVGTAEAQDVKARIGTAAATMVTDGMTIMVLPGSTTAAMLTHLAHRSITVVTNGLEIAHALAATEVELVMLGGVLDRPRMSFLGQLTAQNMADMHVDVMFAGAWGVNATSGVTSDKVMLAGYHHAMLQHADALVVLATGEKFGRSGPTLLAEVKDVDTFVTDAGAPDDVVDGLRTQGATVRVC